MGGLLALALAQRRPDRVAALTLLATPWDFHADAPGTIRMMRATAPSLNALIDRLGYLPVDVIQAMFSGLDPYLTSEKFRRFAALDQGSRKIREFVALEDWLNDGVPLVGSVARECLLGWYVENTPAEGRWRIAGAPVDAAQVTAPTLVVIPDKDHIVPPGSTRVLATAVPGAEALTLPAGHIGMVAGGRARTMLYVPLARWLRRVLT
jgi:polyhydroxyalkanoate synthase